MESLTSLAVKPFVQHPLGIPRARPLHSGIVVKSSIGLTPPTTLIKLNIIPLPPKRPFIRPKFARTGSPASLALKLWIFLFEDSSCSPSSGLFTLPDVFLTFALDFIKFLKGKQSERGAAKKKRRLHLLTSFKIRDDPLDDVFVKPLLVLVL